MKHAGDVVEILEAFDLTGSLREAARLTGCSPMTVARYVRLRETGQATADPVRRDQILDPFLPKLEEWVERSRGRVRADVGRRGTDFGLDPRAVRRGSGSPGGATASAAASSKYRTGSSPSGTGGVELTRRRYSRTA